MLALVVVLGGDVLLGEHLVGLVRYAGYGLRLVAYGLYDVVGIDVRGHVE